MLRHRTSLTYLVSFLLLDQVTKRLFVDQKLLPEFFTSVINTGAARSAPIPVWIIAAVAIGMSIYLVIAYTHKTINTFAAILFFAGIRGNIIDRIFYPWVRDFIVTFDRFPIFNLADVYLTVAVIILIIREIKETQKPTT